jgi:hypothetical protein
MRIRIRILIKRPESEAITNAGSRSNNNPDESPALLSKSSASKLGSKKQFPYILRILGVRNVAYFFQGESGEVVSGLEAGAKDCWTY